MRWFVGQGIDLETNYPIAQMFRDKHREFLGVFLDIRDRVPNARKQVAMALRHHAAEGNLKWVSLLLWAGADPRLPVPRMADADVDEEDVETAIQSAVRHGHIEVVRRFKIDAARDDVTALANDWCLWPNPGLLELLITLGADVRTKNGAIENAFSSFQWSVDSVFSWQSRTDETLRCIEILGASGARWEPKEPSAFRHLRRALAKVSGYDAIRYLQLIVKAGAIDRAVFQELMRTPRMKEILKANYSGVVQLRELAGCIGSQSRKSRM